MFMVPTLFANSCNCAAQVFSPLTVFPELLGSDWGKSVIAKKRIGVIQAVPAALPLVRGGLEPAVPSSLLVPCLLPLGEQPSLVSAPVAQAELPLYPQLQGWARDQS